VISFHVITLFPETIESYTNESIIKRAQKAGKVEIKAHNLRDYATDKHKTVDDRIYGGGPGMLIKVDVVYRAITAIKEQLAKDYETIKVILFSPKGEFYDQSMASEIVSREEDIAYILLCGHYEGFDERVMHFVDEEISMGPFILTGGELPALIMIDSITRLLQGVLSNPQSSISETTFEIHNGEITVDGEHSQYTRPEKFSFVDTTNKEKILSVPEDLLSGHHLKITEKNKKNRISTKRKLRFLK